MSEHTFGPWMVDVNRGQYSVRRAGNHEVIARIARWDPDIEKADAHLIAAAPDLLAACKAFMDADESDDAVYTEAEVIALGLIRAAITKAEGVQQ